MNTIEIVDYSEDEAKAMVDYLEDKAEKTIEDLDDMIIGWHSLTIVVLRDERTFEPILYDTKNKLDYRMTRELNLALFDYIGKYKKVMFEDNIEGELSEEMKQAILEQVVHDLEKVNTA